MKRSSVKWVAVALLLSLAMQTATSMPDDKPEPATAVKAEGSKAEADSAATKNVASDNHYKFSEREYEGYEPDREGGYPWIEGHKGYKKHEGEGPDYYQGEGYKKYDGEYKPDYYRGASHIDDGHYKHKHHGYYPKHPTPPPPPPPPPAVNCPFCPENLTECDAGFGPQCFDLDLGAPFCGACDNICPDGAICNNGTCECTGTLEPCFDTDNSKIISCSDFLNDPNNCGGCNSTCNTTTDFCNAGTCAPNPTEPPCNGNTSLTQCFPSQSAAGNCVDLQTDPLNCGRCGKSCPALLGTGATCTNGECCVPNKGSCVVGFQCCGFDLRAFIPGLGPILFPTTRCQGPGDNILGQVLNGKCCKDANSECSGASSTECCSGFQCRQARVGPIPVGPFRCLPPL